MKKLACKALRSEQNRGNYADDFFKFFVAIENYFLCRFKFNSDFVELGST